MSPIRARKRPPVDNDFETFYIDGRFSHREQGRHFYVPNSASRAARARCHHDFLCPGFTLLAQATTDSSTRMSVYERAMGGRFETLQPDRTRGLARRYHSLEERTPYSYWLRRRAI